MLGEDPAPAGRAWRARIGVVSQGEGAGQALTRAGDARPLRRLPRDAPADRTSCIAAVGLEEQAGTRVGRLSGGQRRRLAVALGVQGRPGAGLPRRADDRAWTRSPAASSGS